LPNTNHNWNVTTDRARELQRELRDQVREEALPGPVELVAGADVSYTRGSNHLFAAVVVMDAVTHEVVEIGRAESDGEFPSAGRPEA
jgi:deoxyribonuclease V